MFVEQLQRGLGLLHADEFLCALARRESAVVQREALVDKGRDAQSILRLAVGRRRHAGPDSWEDALWMFLLRRIVGAERVHGVGCGTENEAFEPVSERVAQVRISI